MKTHNRGWALMDLMVTIGLVAIVLSMAATLLTRSMTLTERAAEADATVRNFEQMQMMLKRDMAAASSVSVEPTAFVTPQATWRIESTRVTRVSGSQVRLFKLPQARLRFEPAAYGATLVVESDSQDATRLPLVSPSAWSREALR